VRLFRIGQMDLWLVVRDGERVKVSALVIVTGEWLLSLWLVRGSWWWAWPGPRFTRTRAGFVVSFGLFGTVLSLDFERHEEAKKRPAFRPAWVPT
jgi:hypothetical protein